MIDLGRSSVLQVAELAWNSVRREFQLCPASGSRDVLGEAKGVLSERFNITADAALAVLERLAAQCNSSVDEVSRQLIKDAPAQLRRPDDAAHAERGPAGDQGTELKRQLIREGTRC